MISMTPQEITILNDVCGNVLSSDRGIRRDELSYYAAKLKIYLLSRFIITPFSQKSYDFCEVK